MSAEVDRYIAAQTPAFAKALTTLRARLLALLPDHVEVMSYAMPGLRQPGPKGKMVVGYAGFTHHLGLYPHSGGVVPQIDCTPFKTSNSPSLPEPRAVLARPWLNIWPSKAGTWSLSPALSGPWKSWMTG